MPLYQQVNPVTPTGALTPSSLADIAARFPNIEDWRRNAAGALLSDTATVQAAVTGAAGEPLKADVGQYTMEAAITSSLPVHLYGAGHGHGPGASAVSNANVTQFLKAFDGDDLFAVDSLYPSIFRDFQINVPVPNRPQTGGAGIRLHTSTGSVNASSKIENIGFTNLYTSAEFYRCSQQTLRGCTLSAWVNEGILVETDTSNEGGTGYIDGNYFHGTSYSTTQGPCVRTRCGYGFIQNNLLLGGAYGVEFAVRDFPAGSLHILDNHIENQGIAGVRTTKADADAEHVIAMLEIGRNEFSVINGTLNSYLGSIVLEDYGPGTSYLTDAISIRGNTHRHNIPAASQFVWVQSGKHVDIRNEKMVAIGANGPMGIRVGGGASDAGLIAPITVADIDFTGTFGTKYTFPVPVIFRDSSPVAWASVPANIAAGSFVAVSG